ncbi:MAG: vanadium-dependent haloperoxidase [Pirellulaceae bacterium]|nr:vanadium-dependent haloperoxidase [Pirellulaceae bacterium]
MRSYFTNAWRRGLLVLVLPLAMALAPPIASSAHADTVTDWNAIMQATVSTPPSNAVLQTRWGAITQLAVFEAVNAIEGDYEPYLGDVIVAPAGASPDAAAIAAAHRTLVTLRPGNVVALDAARAASLLAIPDGQAKEDGIAVGETAALAMLMLRAGDGWDAVVPYVPGTEPGDWQPTPPALAPAFLPHWGQVTPFGLEEGSQFRLPPPPALRTGKYANDYLEVMLLGRFDSPFRPQDRTDVARFYAAATPVQVFNSAARQVSAAQGKSLSENARIFALLAMAMGDAAIAGWETKYHYNFWRPVSAIQNGDLDGNRKTDRDPGWLPLIPTPAFPGYASGHATVSGAARAVLGRAFGKDGHAVTLTHPAAPGIVLDYTAWNEITDDIDDARVYGGIHFRFDQETGARQGRHVGKYILRNYLRSADDDDFDDDE